MMNSSREADETTARRAACSESLLPGALALTMMLTACASSPHAAREVGDRAISTQANEALAAAGLAPRLQVRCYSGVLTLLGQAPDSESRQAADLLRGVPGVARVNNLVLSEDSSVVSGFARPEKAPIQTGVLTGASAGK